MEPANRRVPTQNRGLETRQKLTDAALELFKSRGFEATTAKLISERAGVAIGTFYVYFKDKKEIFTELMDTYYQQFQALDIRRFFVTDDPPEARHIKIRQLLKSISEYLRSMGDFGPALTLLYQQDPGVRSEIQKFEERLISTIVEIFQTVPGVHRSSDPRAQAYLLYTFIESTMNNLICPLPSLSEDRVLAEAGKWIELLLYPGEPSAQG